MIKNLLFDLGGVIMDIEKERCVASFQRLGLPDAASYFGDYSQQGPFMLLEEGVITPDDFHHTLSQAIGNGVTDQQIDDAFCDFLIGIPAERLAQLRELRKKYNVYMLSNTNPIMWRSKIADEFTKEGKVREDYFDGMVTSVEAKSMKPDEKIFRYAIDKLGIRPEETIFLDDSQRNLDAAARIGFKTLLVNPGKEFFALLTAEGF
ncbi:MAG: HAD family phosphatase [Muribaculaceae bacterium]|nr:HAD family phosphatase [Muribaculaceae bacterium]